MKKRSSKQVSASELPVVTECQSCGGSGLFPGLLGGKTICNACHGSGFAASAADEDLNQKALLQVLGGMVRGLQEKNKQLELQAKVAIESSVHAKALVKAYRVQQPLAIRAFDKLVKDGTLLFSDAFEALDSDIAASIEYYESMDADLRERCCAISQKPRPYLLRVADPANGDIETMQVEIDTYGS